jgi:hypothetical protein
MSTKGADGIRVKPTIDFLFDLVEKVEKGVIRVPDFQRAYVWREDQMTDLFDSVVKSYPIGSLFFWSTEEDHATSNKIGPIEQPPRRAGASMQLILDGQQRLTTLVGVLRASENAPREWQVFYDPELRRFCHPAADGTVEVHWVAVSNLTDTIKILNASKRLMEADEKKARSWIPQLEVVARALAGYKVPIIEYIDNNLGSAVEVFSRLNQKGSKITADQLVSALTYREADDGGRTFRLADYIDELVSLIETMGFGTIDRTFVLRCVLAAADMDIYRTNWSSLGKELREKSEQGLPAAVEQARRGLKRAVKFLRQLGVHNQRLLPYGMQLVALCAFFGRCRNPSKSQVELLTKWFWVSSFSAWFGSSNPSQERRLIEELRDVIAPNSSSSELRHFDLEQPALPIPSKFDQRSARVRALMNVMIAQGPKRADGTELGARAAKLLVTKNASAIGHILPSRGEGLRASPANRILAVKNEPGIAKNWLLELPADIRNDVLRSHAIPPNSYRMLRDGKSDEFLALRIAYLQQLEHHFMDARGVQPPKEGSVPSLSPIDTDD